MIAIQKPLNPLATMPSYHSRPTHGRHPSAPVVVRPTQTPGLLSLSKPFNPQAPRQQQQAHPRAPRSPKGKSQRPQQQKPLVQGADEAKQPASKRPEADKVSTAAPAPQEKAPRGRQPKQASHDQTAGRRSMSLSTRPQARRPAHQPSPPPAEIPQEADDSARPHVNPLRAQPATDRPSDSNLFDPFLVQPSQDNESAVPKVGSHKPSTFRAPPELARPTGKLARRRQNAGVPSTPTPSKAVPVPRANNGKSSAAGSQLSRSEPQATVTPSRPNPRRVSTGPAVALPSWDAFPVCDDSDDVTPPSTPIRESSSVPAKKLAGATWQQQALFVDDAPRTAPLSATFAYPFPSTTAATPTPAQRRRTPRNHQRVPSEGMFAMSADEDSSSSDASEELKAMIGLLPKRRSVPPTRKSPSPSRDADGIPANFYAGSVFQNSPSPDELPVPAFNRA